MIFASDRKKLGEFHHLAEKGHILKESGVKTQGKRKVEAGTLN